MTPVFLLADYFIRPVQHRLGDCEVECLRGLEINYQLELGRLLNWKIFGLGAFLDVIYKVDEYVCFSFPFTENLDRRGTRMSAKRRGISGTPPYERHTAEA